MSKKRQIDVKWKQQLADLKPTLPDKSAIRRGITRKEVITQTKIVVTRINDKLVRKSHKTINF